MEESPAKQKKVIIQREFSSGGIVYKEDAEGNILWLVAKSTPSPSFPKTFWRLQKGWIDDEENGRSPGKLARGETKASESDLQEAAIREVKEEGGVLAKIIKKLPTERYFYINSEKQRVMKFVSFYLMKWLKDLPEGPGFETSEVKWLPYADAHSLLTHTGEKKIIKKAKEILDLGIQSSLV